MARARRSPKVPSAGKLARKGARPKGRTNGKASGNSAALIESLVTALESSRDRNSASKRSDANGQNAILIIQPSERGIVLYCPNKEAACANLKRLSTTDHQEIEVCEQIHERISQVVFDNSDTNLVGLKQLKRSVKDKIKTLLKDEPEKSYTKKVRNGREYWYEVWWDPEEKKKKDRYIGKTPPDFLVEHKKV